MKSRSKKQIIGKRDENTIITCQRSTDKHKQLLLLQENTQEGCQSSPWQQKLLFLSHVHTNLDLSIWSIDISTNLSYFFCLLLATGLVGFKWNLLHNLFHFDNGMQYIHVH